MVATATHLTQKERNILEALLRKYGQFFDGTLGTWKRKPYDIQLKKGEKPYHGRPYQAVQSTEATFNKEIERLCKLGVLRKVS